MINFHGVGKGRPGDTVMMRPPRLDNQLLGRDARAVFRFIDRAAQANTASAGAQWGRS
jgi:hypothetical protein